ncbi:MAG: NAD(P)/FAD-dependent oxidoreductase [Myxococcota bacterium]
MHYVIIGNGVAGIEAAFAIRQRHEPSKAKITVISDESEYFFSRTALMYAYMDKMPRKMLEPYDRGAYDKQQINLVHDRVVNLDADAQRLHLRDGDSIPYDKLLLAVGAKPRMVPFGGLDNVDDGIVHLVSMQDLDRCEALTPSTDQAVVIGGGLIGVELAECLNFHGVDVTFLVREPWFWPMALGEEEGDIIAEHIREHGIDLRLEEQLEEMFPDENGRVSHITTNQGNKIDCQMLGIAIGVVSNTEWLEQVDTPPEVNRGIIVDRAFKTTLPNVWAAGDCVEIKMGEDQNKIETIWYSAKLHGKLAGLSMLGDDIWYEPPLFYNSTKFLDLEFTTVGSVTDTPSGTQTLFRKMPDEPISQRIVLDEDDRVIGFNMLGSRWDHRVLENWIREKRSLDFVLDNLRDAQFDVEFGRVPLKKMNETEVTL